MRKISLVFLSAVFLVSTSLSATEPEPVSEVSKELSSKITKLLENQTISVKEDLTAMVMITINEENEIVVISVETGDANLEQVIKSRLNYEKVDLAPQHAGKLYKVPVRVTA
ncbi:hypothetical protein LVD13_06960 [Flavobacteriaceae bacterium D16]|nr:hypothetical protein [Flavobacteriaceae bacterium D16]